MHHFALAVLDLDVDQVAHVVRVIDIRCGHVIRGAVRPRLAERARVVMPLRGTAGLAGADLVDVHGVFAVAEAFHHHLDGHFLDALGTGLFFQRGRAGNVRVGAALDLRRGFHAVAIGARQRRQADQRGGSNTPPHARLQLLHVRFPSVLPGTDQA